MAQVLLPPSSAHDEQSYFASSNHLHRSSSTPSLSYDSYGYSLSRSPSPSVTSRDGSEDWRVSQSSSSSPASPAFSPHPSRSVQVKSSSFHSGSPSSISLCAQARNQADDEEELAFPSYDDGPIPPSKCPAATAPTADHEDEEPIAPLGSATDSQSELTSESDQSQYIPPVADDTAIQAQPSRQVDYLSHDWREEDIWSSWKHIVSRRKVYGERSRLENASWRTWAKQKHRLKTVSPETLNWLKDYDVTWLYGPLQEGRTNSHSEPASCLSKSNSFLNKKPILKKRSVSEEMLHKSLSSSSLLKQAAAAVQAQRTLASGKNIPISRPRPHRSASDFSGIYTPTMAHTTTNAPTSTVPSSSSSGLHSPEPGNGRHIRFNNDVEQCIAVDFKDFTVEDEAHPEWMRTCPSSDSEEDLPTLKTKPRRLLNTPSSSRNSFSRGDDSNGSKGIAKLPSTTLKYHQDDPRCSGHDPSAFLTSWRAGTLSASASQETLRPSTSHKSAGFLLNEEDDDADLAWEPSGAFNSFGKQSSRSDDASPFTTSETADQNSGNGNVTAGMRRTPSGMFMPFDEDEDQEAAAQGNSGIMGRVVNTVNTAKDICYVLYNVGWRK